MLKSISVVEFAAVVAIINVIIIAAVWRLQSLISQTRELNVNNLQVVLHLGIFSSVSILFTLLVIL